MGDQEDDDEAEQKEENKEEKKEEEEEVDEKVVNSELNELNKLVGKIHPEDQFENLVVMCAPYNSIK